MADDTASPPPLSGRRGQAARNDERILEAARAVFVADPGAPIAAVAQRAGVGISALYRRYPSKEELLRRLCADGLATYIEAAEAAVAAEGDVWAAFEAFMHRVVEADTHALTVSLAGTFTPTPQMWQDAARAGELNQAVFARVQDAGLLRPGVVVEDLGNVFEQLTAVKYPDDERTLQMRRRYLRLILDGLRPAAATQDLPGPPPTWDEQQSRWGEP